VLNFYKGKKKTTACQFLIKFYLFVKYLSVYQILMKNTQKYQKKEVEKFVSKCKKM